MKRRQLIAGAAGAALLSSSTLVAAAEKPEPFPVKGKVTVVDFGASWCAGCPEMAQRMKEMQQEYGDRAAFVVIDIDEYPGIEHKYLIDRMPHQRFYDAFGEPAWAHNGDISKEDLRDRVDFLIDYSKKKLEEEKAKKAAK